MNNKIRRSIAAVCAVAAICSPLTQNSVFSGSIVKPVVASAEGQPFTSGACSGAYFNDEQEGVQIYYMTKNNGIVITGCKTSKAMTSVRIPKQIDNKDVISVADNAFNGQTNISSVEFYGINGPLYSTYTSRGRQYTTQVRFTGGSSISEIGESAFENCTNLTYVQVGDKELTVKDSAFSGCTKFGTISFNSSSKNNIDPTFGNIGAYAFAQTNIEWFGFTDTKVINCKKIGYEAFNECARLREININATSVDSRCFQKCSLLTNIKIKADSIGKYCFSRSYNVTSADLDVATINEYAFSGCSKLKKLNLVNTKKIHQHAFENCTELVTVNFPKTITSIGDLAFLGDTKLSSPVSFIRENGERVYIGRGAFNNTAVEYLVLCGDNIKVESYAFCRSNLKAVIVEGNVDLNYCSLNYGIDDAVFTMYGDADTNEYASNYGITYVKADKSRSYDKILDENKSYLMGINKFENANGSCSGMSIMQMFAMTGKVDLSDLLPEGESMIDIPGNAYVDHIPEYSAFCDQVIDYHKNQTSYLHYDYKITFDANTLDSLAKLTEYGVSVPGVLRLYNHRHVVTYLGVEKLSEPVEKYNANTQKYEKYNYRFIIGDSGYRFKYDENGNVVARGADSLTWKPGWTEDMGWIPIEDTYLYVNTEGGCYQQRWDHEENVKPTLNPTTINDLSLLLAPTVHI
ncbi:leucine-rich repeat domain-containing protein [Ruminococcus sp.]|uniref:leucine-rich repeat domain-containing protein n=1 Tax=Ruminococcus sp. TaxID=41978 RepID=UPI0025F1825C|nr:leucine-rich repeat domain-containing protein [Ruminococcus sp.]MCR4638632.1 leucine-rich repeat domain-containing protein [Ruminococcus sp.]